jgi:hypothetical protein
MAIKKVTFSFDVPITQLLGLIATGNAAMKIDVYGDDHPPKAKLLNGHRPKLLEGPKHRPKKRGNKTGYRLLFDQFAEEQSRGFRPMELTGPLIAAGLSSKSVSPQLTALRQHGNVKRVGDKYFITPRGIAKHGKLVAAEAAKTTPEAAEATP